MTDDTRIAEIEARVNRLDRGRYRYEADRDREWLIFYSRSLLRERDEAREIVEELRRHGGDWIVKAAIEKLDALAAALAAKDEALWRAGTPEEPT